MAIGAAFRHTAYIAERPQNADFLFGMGRMFGRIMFLLDSYQDFAVDMVSHKFNPLAKCFSEAERKRQAWRLFHEAYTTLQYYFSQLDLPRPTLLRRLLDNHLREKGQQVIGVHIGAACDCHNRRMSKDLSQQVRHMAVSADGVDSEEDFEPEESESERQDCWQEITHWPYCGGGGGGGCGDGDCDDSGDCGDGDCGGGDCGDCGGGDCGAGDCGGADCGGGDCS